MELDDKFNELKSRVGIKEVISHFYMDVDRQNKALCPFHNEKTPSFSIDEKENIFKCFGCGVGGDAVKFVAMLKEISNLDAAKLIDNEFGLRIFDSNSKPTKPIKKVERKVESMVDENFETNPNIKPYLQECAKNIEKQEYMQSRGLTIETLKKFKVGYDIQRNAITIPYSSNLSYYQTRMISEKKFFKPKKEDAGEEPLYNVRALAGKTRTPIFIVESPICAMSIAQEGGVALATCGTGCLNKLKEALKKTKPKGALILCFDNDDAGKQATKDVSAELDKLEVKYLVFNLAEYCKDPNEMLIKNKDRFQLLIQVAIDRAKKLTATKFDLQSAAELREEVIPPPFWVVKDLLPEGLSLLVASSKLGKSWMAQQICIEVARGGKFLEHQTNQADTVYLALEDSKKRVQTRMNIYLGDQPVPKGYKYSIEAPTLDTGLMDTLEMYMNEYPNIKLIVIDTLQRVRGMPLRNESAYATDYREMNILKAFAYKYHICILILHHVRKMSDSSDAFNMINGTNGLIGVSDNSWVIYKKNRMDLEATMATTGRDIGNMELIIRKGEKNGRWDLVGDAEQQEAMQKRDEYEKNPIVKVIKELLKRQPSGWQGTVTQFKMESIAILNDGTRLPSDTKVGMELNHLTYDLGLDGIIHEVDEKKTRVGKRHYFYLKNKYTGKAIKPNNYEQQGLLD